MIAIMPPKVVNGLPQVPIADWLGNSVWQRPEVGISRIRSSASITAVSFHRSAGEGTWRGARHRVVLTLDHLPSYLVQVEGGHTWQKEVGPGGLAFHPVGLTLRVVQPTARMVQVLWDADLYSALLPELGAATSRFEYQPLKDPLVSQIVTSLAQESGAGFADKILIESLGTALCIRIAQHFVGQLPLPTSQGLSPGRLRRVRDYIEAHIDEDLSLVILADIASLSPYHFSRSFKQSIGIGPQRYCHPASDGT